MTIRNPIDQRHANPTATHCPVFWRRFGTPLAWFLALYPLVAIVCMAATIGSLCLWAVAFGTKDTKIFDAILNSMLITLWGGGALLLPIGIAWCVVMRIAVNRGLASKSTWWTCLALGGSPALPVLLVVLIALMQMLPPLETFLALTVLALFGLLTGLVSVRWIRSRSRRQHPESSHDYP